VEKSLISADVLTYKSENPFPFIVTGWTLMMISILGLSDICRKWLVDLNMFKKLQKWRVVPAILASLIFAAFYIWEGYFGIAGTELSLMYLGMMVLGLIYSSRCSIEWNTSLIILSVILGGYMELFGSLAGFWHYHYDERLAIFIIIAWTLNSWEVHGIALLTGVNLSESMVYGGDTGNRTR